MVGMTKIVAWDPGASGAFVWVRFPGVKWDRPTRQWRGEGLETFGPSINGYETFLIGWIRTSIPFADRVIYEEQTGFGGESFKSTSFFGFGRSFGETIGFIKMRIHIAKLTGNYPTLHGILPQRWQSSLSLPKIKRSKDESKGDKAKRRTARKRQLRDEAIRMFPDCPFRITLDNCDALLLLHYGLTHLVAGK